MALEKLQLMHRARVWQGRREPCSGLLTIVLSLSQHHCSLPELPGFAGLVLCGPHVWFWVWPLHSLGSSLHALLFCLLVQADVQSFQVCICLSFQAHKAAEWWCGMAAWLLHQAGESELLLG